MTRPLHFLWLARLPTLCGVERGQMTSIPQNITCPNCERILRTHPMLVTHWLRNGKVACYNGRKAFEPPTSANLSQVTCKACLKASLPPLSQRRLCVHLRGQIAGVTECGTPETQNTRTTQERTAVTCRRCIVSRRCR